MSEGPKKRDWFAIEDRLLTVGWFASILLWVAGYLTILFQRTQLGVELLFQPWGFVLQWLIIFCLKSSFFLFSVTSIVILMRRMKRRKAGRSPKNPSSN